MSPGYTPIVCYIYIHIYIYICIYIYIILGLRLVRVVISLAGLSGSSDSGGLSLFTARVEYVLAFQFCYCELCVKN